MRMRKVRYMGRRGKASAFLRYPDGTIGSVRQENEARQISGRPLMVEDRKVNKEVVQHG